MNTSLRGKYCIAGVGETEFIRGSNRTTRAMGAEAIRNAMNDAGLKPEDVDGMLSYHGGDSTPSTSIMYDLGLRPNFYMDCSGGGSSTEALVGLAMGAIEAGMCDTVAIFRSMNGYSQMRIGGTRLPAGEGRPGVKGPTADSTGDSWQPLLSYSRQSSPAHFPQRRLWGGSTRIRRRSVLP